MIENIYLLKDGEIAIRKMNNSIADKSLVLKWLTNPSVVALAYSEGVPWDMEKVEHQFRNKLIGVEAVTICIIEYNGKAIGFTQFYQIENDSYCFNEQVPYKQFVGGYGMDIVIGCPELWGKGIGTKIVLSLKNYLISTLGAKVVCADPEQNNERSVRCWLKAGFMPAGKIQNYDEPNRFSIFMVAKP